MVRHEMIDAAGRRLRVARQGAGPVVLLLHGFPEGWFAWRAQMAGLAAAGFEAVAPDLPGYGGSDKPGGLAPYDLEPLADVVAALVARVSPGAPVALAGHDWGGPVAWTTAHRHPGLVARLAIIDGPHPRQFLTAIAASPRQALRSAYVLAFVTPVIPELAFQLAPRAAFAALVRRYAARPERIGDDQIDEMRAAIRLPGAARAGLAYYRALVTRGLRGRGGPPPATARCPVLVLWAEQDPALGLEVTEGLEPYCPAGLERRVVPRCGHWVMREAPDEVTAALVDWAAAARDGRRAAG
jgi:pimeloyl-ACP methyl ester carboxylesterase